MAEKPILKPPFEVEFPSNGVDWPEHVERQVEQGEITPRMADIRSRAASPVKRLVKLETATPSLGATESTASQPSEVQTPKNILTPEEFAQKYGGRADDYNPDFQ